MREGSLPTWCLGFAFTDSSYLSPLLEDAGAHVGAISEVEGHRSNLDEQVAAYVADTTRVVVFIALNDCFDGVAIIVNHRMKLERGLSV